MNSENGFVTVENFCILLVLQLLAVGLIIFFWKKIWLNTQMIYLPNKRDINKDQRTEYSRISQIREAFYRLKQIISQFDAEYINQNIGFEGYTYLAFQRRILKILTLLCILDLGVWIPYLLFFQDIQNFSLITMDSEGAENFRTTYTIIISVIILYFLLTFKKFISYSLRFSMIKNHDFNKTIQNWLKLRTLNIKILQNVNYNSSDNDRAQNHQPNNPTLEVSAKIRDYFQKFLYIDCQLRSKIFDIILIPDYYGQLLELQYDLKYYEIVNKLLRQEQKPWLWTHYNFYTAEEVRQKIQLKNRMIQTERSIQQQNYINAFMIVEKMAAVDVLCNNFKQMRNWNLCQKNQQAEFVDQKIQFNFIVNKAQSPHDIIWSNLQYHKYSNFRYIGFNILCIMILVFISTPSTVLNLIQLPPLITPFVVLITNTLLSFCLSKMVQQQKHIQQSKKEENQFNMLIFYLSINVLLVSIARGVKNVTQLLTNNQGWGWVQVFYLVYRKVDGFYYCQLCMNQTLSSFFTALIKPTPLFENYGSPLLFLQSSAIYQNIAYGKNDNFQFGYYYALLVVQFSLSIIFSSAIPLIHFFCLLFFLARYYLDTYTLLAFHRQQTVSIGGLITKTLFSVAIAVVVQIFLVANSLLNQQRYINTIILYALCAIGLYIAIELKKPLVNELDLMKDDQPNQLTIKESTLNNWRKLYKHPSAN